MTAATLLAIACSAAALWLIGRRDPKRLRARAAGRHGVAAHTPAQRRRLTVAAALPGALLAIAGQSAGFILWLGATVALGWLLVQALAVGGRSPRTSSRA
ncbi:MAG: hypothetical protein QM661_12220 [Solimonas sp.]